MAANLEPSTDVRPSGSKLDLIQATVAAISQHGLSELTSAKIAGVAGHTAASINFHFGSKEALLLATLREVSEEFAGAMARVLEEAGDDDLRALLGIVDASLGRALSDSHKIAVWYAFLAESKARGDYQRICGERDSAWSRMVIDLCKTAYRGARERTLAGCRGSRPGAHGPHRPAVAGDPVRGRRLRPRGCAPPVPRVPLQRLPLARAAHRGRRARARQAAGGARGRRRPRDQADAPGLGLPQRRVPRAREGTHLHVLVAGRLPRRANCRRRATTSPSSSSAAAASSCAGPTARSAPSTTSARTARTRWFRAIAAAARSS